jgi:hypothetical protein
LLLCCAQRLLLFLLHLLNLHSVYGDKSCLSPKLLASFTNEMEEHESKGVLLNPKHFHAPAAATVTPFEASPDSIICIISAASAEEPPTAAAASAASVALETSQRIW